MRIACEPAFSGAPRCCCSCYHPATSTWLTSTLITAAAAAAQELLAPLESQSAALGAAAEHVHFSFRCAASRHVYVANPILLAVAAAQELFASLEGQAAALDAAAEQQALTAAAEQEKQRRIKELNQRNMRVNYKTIFDGGAGGGAGGAAGADGQPSKPVVDLFSRRATKSTVYWNTKGKGAAKEPSARAKAVQVCPAALRTARWRHIADCAMIKNAGTAYLYA